MSSVEQKVVTNTSNSHIGWYIVNLDHRSLRSFLTLCGPSQGGWCQGFLRTKVLYPRAPVRFAPCAIRVSRIQRVTCGYHGWHSSSGVCKSALPRPLIKE
jgi:hypothetical protein